MKKTTSSRTRKSEQTPRRSMRARPVAELVPDVGRATFRKFGFVQHSVVSRWSEIVGERFAGVSAPESIRFPPGKRAEGVLTLIAGGAHAPMLQHLGPEIVERVNRFFGYPAIARVAIRHGSVQRRQAAPPPPAPTPIPEELGESLRTVADPELRAVLESLAAGVAKKSTEIPMLGKIS
ncbi:DUF721 domain-containing protein [Stakelama tenebrarum]|uniref:DUF721 domain-containing protein n=1 Tax=Stakelama tenebrarum TaxID=2711215 RepID=A0A6G6Y0K6_9SPHN|nr:DciA family protein [Sphingosinithalassobacter tenebrarum]QIG78452.1 DUF721 domain-containing protein [Sphingosinithalassobacter tenebrarum]